MSSSIDLTGNRRSALIIDLDAIKYNLSEIKKKVKKDVKICAVVKADAYGYGAVRISEMIERFNLADYLAVAIVDEGIELREAGIKLPILILGLIMPDEAPKAIKNNLTMTTCYQYQLDAINISAKSLNKIGKIHIKIDTGMGRIGCSPEETLDLVKHAISKKNLYLEGIFSHFSTSELRDKSFSMNQLDLFKKVITELEMHEIHIPIKHMANSGAVLDLLESYFDMVRPGSIIYGWYPSDETSESIKLKPVMNLRSEIIYIKRVKKDSSVSYGRTYITQKDTYIAILPIGYADGIFRLLSNDHEVMINGKLYPIAGRVCMDQTIVDLGDDYYPIGTEVEIFGSNSTSIANLAKKLNTIPNEIVTRMKRVKRFYLE